jgi:hypothetical protein
LPPVISAMGSPSPASLLKKTQLGDDAILPGRSSAHPARRCRYIDIV